MKREAYTHPKMMHLSALLDCSRAAAIGYVSLLLDFTGQYSPQGDIGKFANGAIARACDWAGNPDAFVDAMVESGWLDRDDSHRLLVHDWATHCENWIKSKLHREGLSFAVSTPVGTAVASPVGTAVATQATPPITKPNQTNNRKTNKGSDRNGEPSTQWGGGVLANISDQTLRDTQAVVELHAKFAADPSIPVTDSEADQLRVLAAAEHALRVGTKSPAGLFRKNIEAGTWNYSSADEEAANAKLKALRRTRDPPSATVAELMARTPLKTV